MRRFLICLLCVPFVLLTGCAASPASTAGATESPSADALETPASAAARPSSAAGASADEASSAPVAETEITIFAAASLQETLTEIQALYRTVDPSVVTVCNFDSSGTLKTQIEQGAACDVFISAAQKQMNQLGDGEDGEEGLHLIDSATRVSLLENKVVLVVPEGNPAGLTGFEDMAEKLQAGEILLAVGNSDVPVGQYTARLFDFLGLDEQELAAAGTLSYGSNVKEVTTQVAAGSVAGGIVYATDAFSAGLPVVAEATAEMCGQVIYPAAVLQDSRHKEAAEAFLAYLRTPEAMAVFESVGFSPAP